MLPINIKEGNNKKNNKDFVQKNYYSIVLIDLKRKLILI